MVDQIIRELSVHAAIEEAYFYTEVKKAFGEGSELVDESLHEHQEVKEILAALWRTWTRPVPPTTRRWPP